MLVGTGKIQDDPKLWPKQPGGQYFYSLNDGRRKWLGEKMVGSVWGLSCLSCCIIYKQLYHILVEIARGVGEKSGKFECYKGQKKKQSHTWYQMLLR